MELSEDQEQQIRAFIEALNNLCSGERDTCLHCNTLFSELKQVGRCVYAYPCGHRQYQGTLPERWKPQKKIHPYLLEQQKLENE